MAQKSEYKEKKRTFKSGLNRLTMTDAILAALMVLLSVIILYPFWNAALISFMPQAAYMRSKLPLFPIPFTLESYKFVVTAGNIWRPFGNSVFITLVGTAYNMIMTIMTAFALTREFPGKKIIMGFILFTMIFSGGVIPYYLLMKDLHLINKIWVMIIPTGFTVMYMMIISQYFTSIPISLQESAKIDGAGDFMILFRIILPLSLPMLATFTLYYAVDRWNEWYHCMLFVKKIELWSLQYKLREVINDAMAASQQNIPGKPVSKINAEGVKMATLLIAMLPVMSIYPFLQRFFLSGLTLGAVKE